MCISCFPPATNSARSCSVENAPCLHTVKSYAPSSDSGLVEEVEVATLK